MALSWRIDLVGPIDCETLFSWRLLVGGLTPAASHHSFTTSSEEPPLSNFNSYRDIPSRHEYNLERMELLFDLDGTLTDPERGITQCISHALNSVGRPSPPIDVLRRYIGPPLRKTFAELLETEDESAIDAALGCYRDRFVEVGMYENELYGDVPRGLDALRERGHRLWVATSKPEVYARRILGHFELSTLFQNIYGSELSGERADKGALIAHILERERLDPSDVWMIGDRSHDIVGGRANNTRTMGVLWGYGSEEELLSAKPDCVADSISTLIALVDATAPRARRLSRV
jgi:phosphoglycolate phosphatase